MRQGKQGQPRPWRKLQERQELPRLCKPGAAVWWGQDRALAGGSRQGVSSLRWLHHNPHGMVLSRSAVSILSVKAAGADPGFPRVECRSSNWQLYPSVGSLWGLSPSRRWKSPLPSLFWSAAPSSLPPAPYQSPACCCCCWGKGRSRAHRADWGGWALLRRRQGQQLGERAAPPHFPLPRAVHLVHSRCPCPHPQQSPAPAQGAGRALVLLHLQDSRERDREGPCF